MRRLKLPHGKITVVDDEDYSQLSSFSWYRTRYGYAAAVVDKKWVLLHRFIMKAGKGSYLDHINGDRLDNRRENLRFCSVLENSHNRQRRRQTHSGLKGVYRTTNPRIWRATITVNGKQLRLGHFGCKLTAAKAYDEAAKKHFGEFARPNTST